MNKTKKYIYYAVIYIYDHQSKVYSKNRVYKKIEDMSKSKEYGAQLYDAAVLIVGAVGVSFASRKLTKDTLGIPMTLGGSVKLALAFGLSAIGMKMLKDKDLLPDNPFKTS